MAERIISVKMPASLIASLRALQHEHHYLDLSEQLRSIIRQHCLELTNPYTAEIQRLRTDITAQDAQKNAKEAVLQELIRLLKEGSI